MPVPTHTPTEQQLKDFRTFVKVQKSNIYNMMAPAAIQATGLGRERHLFVIKHYDWLDSYSGREEADRVSDSAM